MNGPGTACVVISSLSIFITSYYLYERVTSAKRQNIYMGFGAVLNIIVQIMNIVAIILYELSAVDLDIISDLQNFSVVASYMLGLMVILLDLEILGIFCVLDKNQSIEKRVGLLRWCLIFFWGLCFAVSTGYDIAAVIAPDTLPFFFKPLSEGLTAACDVMTVGYDVSQAIYVLWLVISKIEEGKKQKGPAKGVKGIWKKGFEYPGVVRVTSLITFSIILNLAIAAIFFSPLSPDESLGIVTGLGGWHAITTQYIYKDIKFLFINTKNDQVTSEFGEMAAYQSTRIVTSS